MQSTSIDAGYPNFGLFIIFRSHNYRQHQTLKSECLTPPFIPANSPSLVGGVVDIGTKSGKRAIFVNSWTITPPTAKAAPDS
ncbi:hypothetical protein, partial [Ralstonia solanacearum species complex bacterium KE055]|uniref:hypothetical protein n=1 Tax=Ralstonia solanacearum species complex bacterium KE055 TaxID=3119586 RepID=UPI002FC2BCD0